MQAASRNRAEGPLLDAVEQLASFVIERGAQGHAESRIYAIGPREPERRVGTLLAARARERQHLSVQFAVVADLHAAVVIETVHANAELRHDLEVRSDVRVSHAVSGS